MVGVLLILSDREVQMILLWFEFTTLGFFGEKTQQLFFWVGCKNNY